MNLSRNISLVYLLSLLSRPWFWLGIWIFYYLSITNYAGIGLIETVLVLTFFLTEIPTGAVADLLGKKKTLLLAFTLQAACNFIMAFAPNLQTLMLSVLIGAIGGTFYSGTIEALTYDSLLQLKQKDRYEKVIAHMNTLNLIAPAFTSIIGGFLYVLQPSLPFIAAGLFHVIAFSVSLFLIEPEIDTEKFNLHNFISQTKKGFGQLFHAPHLKQQTLLLLSVAGIIVIAEEMLDSFLSFEFGFSEVQMGFLWSVIFLISAASSQLSPTIKSKLGLKLAFIITGIIISFTFIVSPILGLILGGTSLILRSSLSAIFTNLTSETINRHTLSKYRATTISTFNMLKNLPYVFTAFFLGSLADLYSAKLIAAVLGFTLLFLLTIQSLYAINKPAQATTD